MAKRSQKYVAIFIAVAFVGGGIAPLALRSNGGGDSSSNNLTPEQSITHGHGLAVDVQDPNKLYIATHHGLLVLMNDKDLYRAGKSTDDFMGFTAHPADANVLFSSGHPSLGGNIGFQKSDDGGITWKKISDGVDGPVDFHAMAVSSVNPNLIYGWSGGNLQRSTDQGKNWEIVNRDLQPIYLAADSQDENVVYAAATDGQGVVVSRDQGATWTPLSPELQGGFVSVVAIHPQDSKTLLTFSEKLGGLGKSADAGKTWKKVSEGFNGEIVLHISFSRTDPSIVYALTQENGLYKSADVGDTWIQIR